MEIECLAISNPWGSALGHITKNNFFMEIAWNVQICMKLMFLILHITKKG